MNKSWNEWCNRELACFVRGLWVYTCPKFNRVNANFLPQYWTAVGGGFCYLPSHKLLQPSELPKDVAGTDGLKETHPRPWMVIPPLLTVGNSKGCFLCGSHNVAFCTRLHKAHYGKCVPTFQTMFDSVRKAAGAPPSLHAVLPVLHSSACTASLHITLHAVRVTLQIPLVHLHSPTCTTVTSHVPSTSARWRHPSVGRPCASVDTTG